jgi:surface polysaccharide O-acyltransferase-like enzyme
MLVFALMQKQEISLLSFFDHFILGHHHLWYLYMLIGLYLITPILRILTKQEHAKKVLYFILLSVAFQFFIPFLNLLSEYLPITTYVTKLINQLGLDFLFGYTAYYLLGWYLIHIGISKTLRIVLYSLGPVSLGLIIALVQCFPTHIDSIYSNLGILVFLYAVAVFVFILYRKTAADKARKILIPLSKLSFGVYIIHPLILSLITAFVPYGNLPALEIILFWNVAFILSLLVTFILSKIPLLKKLIRN